MFGRGRVGGLCRLGSMLEKPPAMVIELTVNVAFRGLLIGRAPRKALRRVGRGKRFAP